MSTSTSRLALTKPDPADSMAIGDLVLSANYTIIDGAAGAPTYTLATRPGSPWTGRTIWESDTGNFVFYNGSGWAYWGNHANQRGFSGVVTDASITSTPNTEVQLASVTFTATQNRRYRIDHVTYAEHSTPTDGSALVRIRWAAGASVTTGGTLIRETFLKVDSGGTTGRGMYDMCELNYTAADAQITVGIFALSGTADIVNFNATTDGVDVVGKLTVRDWGVS